MNSFKDLPDDIIILYIVSLMSADTCIDIESCQTSIDKLMELKNDLGENSKFLKQINDSIEIVKSDLKYYKELNAKKS